MRVEIDLPHGPTVIAAAVVGWYFLAAVAFRLVPILGRGGRIFYDPEDRVLAYVLSPLALVLPFFLAGWTALTAVSLGVVPPWWKKSTWELP